MTVHQIYEQTIKPLPAVERFRLAVLILNDIPPQLVADYSEEWGEEDYRDFSKTSWEHIDKRLEEEERA
jgi:protoheme ferro-lyase